MNRPVYTWTVYRIDDTGNVFVVKGELGQDEAEKLVQLYEARGHKQMYWAERTAKPETAVDTPSP
ncbi:hypothetical protein [Limnoglobus roseus]|uniref:Putative Rossmann-fold-type glycoside hydrolase n=1 Tax=Limnoglobus roseus TaxID=2598579 RepID=A0A5C1AAM5_9BACT|nr:hypothetical protein [Limnoglobus roseus]QEL15780.1 putative Rossmann-fold-type glycoside hydrolase [Limnoglobus roseus]